MATVHWIARTICVIASRLLTSTHIRPLAPHRVGDRTRSARRRDAVHLPRIGAHHIAAHPARMPPFKSICLRQPRARHAAHRAGRRARQRDLRHARDRARGGRTRRRHADADARAPHAGAGDQPAGLCEAAPQRRPQPEPQARAHRRAARVRGPRGQLAVSAAGAARGAARSALVPLARRAVRDAWAARTTAARSSRLRTPRAKKRWRCAWACSARSTAGSAPMRPARRAAPSSAAPPASSSTPTRATASAPPSTCARSAAARSRSNAASTTTRRRPTWPTARSSTRWRICS